MLSASLRCAPDAIPEGGVPCEAQGAIGFRVNYPPQATLLSDRRTEGADHKHNDHDYEPLVRADVLTPTAVLCVPWSRSTDRTGRVPASSACGLLLPSLAPVW